MSRRNRLLLIVAFVGAGLAAIAFFALRTQKRGPALINAHTRAGQVIPFSTTRDPRFDPLPLEPEKHGK